MIFTIATKELRAMFTSPLAWVVLAFLQFVLALIFLKQIDSFLMVQAQLARTPNAPGLTEIAIVPMFGVGGAGVGVAQDVADDEAGGGVAGWRRGR